MKTGSIVAMLLTMAQLAFGAAGRVETFTLEALPTPVAGETLVLPGFDGGKATIALGACDVSTTGVITFTGRTTDAVGNNVTVTMLDAGYLVRIEDARAGKVRSYRARGNSVTLREQPRAKGGRCGVEAPEHALALPPPKQRVALEHDPVIEGAVFMRRGETVTNVIDVLIAVDRSAGDWIREKSDFAEEDDPVLYFAADAIARCNGMYANTGLDQFFTFNLAGVIEVEPDFSKSRTREGYVDSLALLKGYTDNIGAYKAEWAKIRAKREAVCADLVSVLVACGEDEVEGVVGIGTSLDADWISDAEFSEIVANVCLVEAVATGNTLAHEIGHNMGAGHAEMKNRANSGPQLYDYSTGWKFAVTNSEGVVFTHATTIMGYSADGYEVENCAAWGPAPEEASWEDAWYWNNGYYAETDFFSSSVHTYKYVNDEGQLVDSGVPLGDAWHDNTRLLSQVYPVIANFRARNSALVLDQEGMTFMVDGGLAIDPIGLSVKDDLPAKLTVSGLPAGLKFDAKISSVIGVPTKAGRFSVKVVLSSAARPKPVECFFTIVVCDYELAVTAEPGGTVKGAARALAGKKLSLSAKADQGYVFAGWKDDAGEPLVGAADYRTASWSVVMTNADLHLTASFATAADDAASLAILTKDEYETATDGSFTLDVPVASFSLPKLSLKGLPTGLKFDAKLNRITGVAKKPGVYTVTVSATNVTVKKAITKVMTIVVPNFRHAAFTGLEYEIDAYPMSAGVAFDPAIIDLGTDEGWTLSAIAGLPAGLKFNAKTGEITGIPTKAGSFTVTLTAKRGRETAQATVTFTVAALPTWAYGTFDGGLLAKGQPNGLATLTLSAVGKLSGKLQKDGLSWTVSAASFADWEVADESEELVFFAEAICKSGKLVETNLLGVVRASLADGTTVGRIGFVTDEEEPVPAVDVDAQQNLWKTEPWKTLGKAFANKTIEIEPGVTLKTAASGAVSATGKFVTGQDARGKDVVYSASCSTVLLPFGDGTYEVYLHFPPKSGKFEGRSACVRLAWNQEAQAWQLDD